MDSYRENERYDSWMTVSQDRKEAVLVYVQVLAEANKKSRCIRLKGLDEKAMYEVKDVTGREKAVCRSGAALMNAGFRILPEAGDFRSIMYEIRMKTV